MAKPIGGIFGLMVNVTDLRDPSETGEKRVKHGSPSKVFVIFLDAAGALISAYGFLDNRFRRQPSQVRSKG